jgi:predicted DNA-binding transcriptional regulator AlpA
VTGPQYLSVERVCAKFSRKKTWLYYTMEKDPTFPRPLRLGASPMFIEAQLDEWFAKKQEEPAPPRRAYRFLKRKPKKAKA